MAVKTGTKDKERKKNQLNNMDRIGQLLGLKDREDPMEKTDTSRFTKWATEKKEQKRYWFADRDD